jgi:hypothetical protein
MLSRRAVLASSWCVQTRPHRLTPARTIVDRHRSILAELTVEAAERDVCDDAYPGALYAAYSHLVQQAVMDAHRDGDADDEWIDDLRREYRWLASVIERGEWRSA